MAIRTQQSLSGFIDSDPKLTRTRHGDARFYVRVGQRHYDSIDDGSNARLRISYHDLVVYGVAAERAHDVLCEGESLVTGGHVRTYEHHVDGQTVEREKFVATTLGHDIASTPCTIRRPTEVEDGTGATPEDVRPGQPDRREIVSTPTPPTSRASMCDTGAITG